MGAQSQVKILDKTLQILLLFRQGQPEWSLTAISQEVGMPKSTAHRILSSLTYHGFLAQDPDSRRYRLGLTTLELGRRAYLGLEIRRIARPVMERLAEETGETVLLEVLSQSRDRAVCIERSQRSSGLQLILDVGSSAPLHAGSSSKVLLAFMGDEEVERVIAAGLPALTAQTITDAGALREEVRLVRERGYAVSYEETDVAAAGVSVPIFDYLDQVVAGLTVAGPMTRLNETTMLNYLPKARAAAQEISAGLGRTDSGATPGPAARQAGPAWVST